MPELRGPVRPEHEGITLGAPLSHRAGIRPYNTGREIEELPAFTSSLTQQRLQFAQFVLQQSPVLPTTELFIYSNAGYALAALMLTCGGCRGCWGKATTCAPALTRRYTSASPPMPTAGA